MSAAAETETRIQEPGTYKLDPMTYHADPAPVPSLSRGVAKLLIERSPMHARWHHPRLNPELEQTSANHLRVGQLCHRLLLDDGADLAVWEGPDWRPKAARDHRDAALAEGRIPVTLPQYENAERMYEAALRQLGGDLGERETEVAWIAHEDAPDAWLRCMTDWITDGGLRVWDYKTTSASAHPTNGVPKLAANQSFDFQQAFYERVIQTVRPELAGRIKFRFLVQEVEPPFALVPVYLSEADVAVARRQVDQAVDTWARCLRDDTWPGYGETIARVNLPPWHFREWLEREMEEMGDA